MNLPTAAQLDATLDLLFQRVDDALDAGDLPQVTQLVTAITRVGALHIAVAQLTSFEREMLDFATQ